MAFAGDPTKVNREPMWALFNGVNLGLIAPGDVTVSFTDSWVNQTSHQLGPNAVLESYNQVGSPTIKVKTLEILTMANWAVAFPTGSAQSDGAAGSRYSPVLITDGNTTPFSGKKASAIAQKLILRPAAQYVDASTEKSRDLWFPKAWCSNMGDFQFSADSDMAFDMTFSTLFIPTAGEGEASWIWGLTTGTWVDA